MVTEARRRNCDDVGCGHIHKPEIRTIDGILYLNDGDWVESISALVEHTDGQLEILDWSAYLSHTSANDLRPQSIGTEIPNAPLGLGKAS